MSGPLSWFSGGYFGLLNLLYAVSVLLCWSAVVLVLSCRRPYVSLSHTVTEDEENIPLQEIRDMEDT